MRTRKVFSTDSFKKLGFVKSDFEKQEFKKMLFREKDKSLLSQYTEKLGYKLSYNAKNSVAKVYNGKLFGFLKRDNSGQLCYGYFNQRKEFVILYSLENNIVMFKKMLYIFPNIQKQLLSDLTGIFELEHVRF